MKNIFHKNQVIITSLAIMIAIAGYLNFTDDISLNSTDGEYEDVITELSSNDTQDATNHTTQDDVQNNESSEEKETNNENDSKDDIKNIEKESDTKESDGEKETLSEVSKEDSKIGEAVLVNGNISIDYFNSVKLKREQIRAKNKEELTNIVENSSSTEEQRETALEQIISITSFAEKESAAELLLEAKGFDNAIVSLTEDKADVVVDVESITEADAAVIEDIIKRKTGVERKDIVITPVNSNKE